MSQQIICPRGASLYIWRQGDTLASVALRNRVTVQSIYLVNEGRDLDALRPGDRICLPPGMYACLSGQAYTVRRGDTFASIAQTYGITTWELIERNPYVDPSNLMVGQVLCVPEEAQGEDGEEDSGGTSCAGCCPAGYQQGTVRYGEDYVDLLINLNVSDAAFRAANPQLNTHALLPGQRYCAPPPGSRQAACAGRIYTARDGDTLAMIAERFGTTMRALLERNPNLTPNDFTNGQAFCV
ncbi:MAG: LysM peptidoglycan-binding domain-containing protein [Clostridiales bacterium]|nr:LysM peptidoglycan-binding domain-containing protein [Clostridiales bacterium]